MSNYIGTTQVSCVIPVYNAEKTLRRCVDSILSYTGAKLEVILIDDGSTDGSCAICDEYAKADQRIRVVHKENGGVASAKMRASNVLPASILLSLTATTM